MISRIKTCVVNLHQCEHCGLVWIIGLGEPAIQCWNYMGVTTQKIAALPEEIANVLINKNLAQEIQ